MIKRSELHGVGFFADRDVKQGQMIGQMRMQEVGTVEEFGSQLPTVGVVADNKVYVPWSGFPLWAVNWAAQPNAGVDQLGNVVALRNIQKGEEVTISYYGGKP